MPLFCIKTKLFYTKISHNHAFADRRYLAFDGLYYFCDMHAIRKREGFAGQKAIVLPKKILEVCSFTPPINFLYVTDIGFYPRAQYHYRERPSGISQNILIYCIEGKGWLETAQGMQKVNANEYLLIPAD